MGYSRGIRPTFDLWFFTPDGLPGPPKAYVRLNHYATHGNGEDEQTVLTPDAMSARELDLYIDGLIDELENARRKGKQKFAAHEAAMRVAWTKST